MQQSNESLKELLELGKLLYESEQKKCEISDQTCKYISSIGNSTLDSIDDPIGKDLYIWKLLSDMEVEEKLKNDSQFLYLKREYQKYDEIMDSCEKKISNFKKCALKIDKWSVYQFSEPYTNYDEYLDSEYNVKLKNWKAFLYFFKVIGYNYRKIKILSKTEENELDKPLYIDKRGVCMRYK